MRLPDLFDPQRLEAIDLTAKLLQSLRDAASAPGRPAAAAQLSKAIRNASIACSKSAIACIAHPRSPRRYQGLVGLVLINISAASDKNSRRKSHCH